MPERRAMKPRPAQTEKALSAGKLMSNANHRHLTSFQDVLRQLQASRRTPDSEPFRINHYTAAAAQINATARAPGESLQAFDQTRLPASLT